MVELLRQSRKAGATLLWSANLPVRQIINHFEIAVLYTAIAVLYTAQPFLICTLNTGQLVFGVLLYEIQLCVQENVCGNVLRRKMAGDTRGYSGRELSKNDS